MYNTKFLNYLIERFIFRLLFAFFFLGEINGTDGNNSETGNHDLAENNDHKMTFILFEDNSGHSESTEILGRLICTEEPITFKNEEKQEDFSQEQESISITPSEPQLLSGLEVDKIYEKKVEVSTKFLKNYNIVKEKVEEVLKQFTGVYDQGNVDPLDITCLSSRTRIHLLKKIIEHKRTKLPEGSFYDAWRILNIDKDNIYWDSINSGDFGLQLVDKKPLLLTIAEYSYTLEVRITDKQPGNGVLSGIGIPNRESYGYLIQQLELDPNSPKLNYGLRLLLDFEVVRHLICEDIYSDLPIITCNSFLLKKDIADNLSKYRFIFDGFKPNRRTVIKLMIKENYNIEDIGNIRKELECFCDSDENSEDSGSVSGSTV